MCAVLLLGGLGGVVLPQRALAQQNPYHLPDAPRQSFAWTRLPPWLGIDGQVRGRTENQTALGLVSSKGRLYELTRVRGGLTVRPGAWASLYMQFEDTHAPGLPLRDVSPNMRDQFDLFQGFLRFRYKPAQVWVGRRVLRLGDERVVGRSDWTNNSRSFDGFFLRLGDKDRVDVFSTSVVQVHPTGLDTHGAGLTFHGVYGNVTSLLPKTSLQPFVLVKALPRVVSQQGLPGAETEVTPGFAFDSELPLHFTASGLGDLQRGSYSNDSIHAGAAVLRGGYTWAAAPWAPHLEAEYDYATGNPDRNPYRVSTYDQQYPSNHNVFGLVDLFGYRNIKQRRLSLGLKPRRNLSMLFQTGSLHVATARDAVYAGSGSALFFPPPGGASSDDLGTEFDASGKYVYRKYLVTKIGVGHFFPGEFMTSNHHGAPLTVAYLSLSYHFKVN